MTDVYHYEVSQVAQQRLRTALLQLSRAGRQAVEGEGRMAGGRGVPGPLSPKHSAKLCFSEF